jgi:hypothetical protein
MAHHLVDSDYHTDAERRRQNMYRPFHPDTFYRYDCGEEAEYNRVRERQPSRDFYSVSITGHFLSPLTSTPVNLS